MPGPKSDSLSENLPLETAWARKCDWNSTKRKRWTHSKRCFEMVPNTGKRTKPQFFKMTWRAILEWFFGIFFRYLLPPSEVFVSFLFLRNTNQFWEGRSKYDVCRPPTIEKWEKHGKTNVSKGKPLSVHNLCGSAAPWKLFLHFWTKAVRNAGFQRNFGFGLWWLHFFRLRIYWCYQNQAWTFRAGSRTPSLDSKMCKFPRISLSELWKVRSFRLILDLGFAGQPFLCRIPVNNRPKNEVF